MSLGLNTFCSNTKLYAKKFYDSKFLMATLHNSSKIAEETVENNLPPASWRRAVA